MVVNAKTPNIDRLAEEGFRYTHAYSNAAVCAPSRSGWITGMHGIQRHRSYVELYPIPHDQIVYYPDLLREAGYHLKLSETPYNIGGREDASAWDSWNLSMEKPCSGPAFFSVFNLHESHESQSHGDHPIGATDPDDMHARLPSRLARNSEKLRALRRFRGSDDLRVAEVENRKPTAYTKMF